MHMNIEDETYLFCVIICQYILKLFYKLQLNIDPPIIYPN